MFIIREEIPIFCKECGIEIPFNEVVYEKKYCSKKCSNKKADSIYYSKNKRKIINKVGIYKSKRIKRDINFKILCNLRTRLYQSLKGQQKVNTTRFLMGCSREYILDYIESQFDDEMSWNNYGRTGWHIDHIKPCCCFDLSNIEEQKKCFHYSNLRPFWANDNINKGGSYA